MNDWLVAPLTYLLLLLQYYAVRPFSLNAPEYPSPESSAGVIFMMYKDTVNVMNYLRPSGGSKGDTQWVTSLQEFTPKQCWSIETRMFRPVAYSCCIKTGQM